VLAFLSEETKIMLTHLDALIDAVKEKISD